MIDKSARWLLPNRPWLRRGVLLGFALLCLVLVLYPQRYRAVVTLTPTDPQQLGLGGALGQLGAQYNVFGQQAATEVSLTVARSADVRSDVIAKTNLLKRQELSGEVAGQRWLEKEVLVRSLRGGILEFSTRLTDAELAQQVIVAYSNAVRDRLAEIARQQTKAKRRVLEELVEGASVRLSDAQTAYDSFRLRTRYSDPTGSITAIGARVPRLEEQIRSRETQLAALRQFVTEDNLNVRQIEAEIGVLRRQLAEARSLDPTSKDSVARVVRQSSRVEDLQRELLIARNLYDAYVKFLQGTSVEDLSSALNVRILEPPHIDPARQYNLLPALGALLFLALLVALEFYHLRPPVGALRKEPVADA